MPLTKDEREFVLEKLDQCDAALLGMPTLASVFDPEWRQQLREECLAAKDFESVGIPDGYGAPYFGGDFGPDYQQRIEKGLKIAFEMLPPRESNHLRERFRRRGSLSAVEEVLLICGFAQVFGDGSVRPPSVIASQPCAEFTVETQHCRLGVEVTGVYDSDRVRGLWRNARVAGKSTWVTSGPSLNVSHRIRSALAKKLLKSDPNLASIVVLVRHTPWPSLAIAASEVRDAALVPRGLNIPIPRHPLGTGLISERFVHGVWFSDEVCLRRGVSDALRERLRQAIAGSFYSPRGEAVLDEKEGNGQPL
jgi:hypothetical protein